MAKRELTDKQREALARGRAAKGTKENPIVVGAPDDNELAALRREMQELRNELGIKSKALTEAQAAARNAASSAVMMGTSAQEIPTGEFKMVDKLDLEEPFKVTGHKDDGREILRPNFTRKEKEEAYFYLIDLPTVGFSPSRPPCISLNGREYEHGRVYKFTMDTLRTVKSLVWQSWAHERSLRSNENEYRKPLAINAAADPGALAQAIAQQQGLRSTRA